MTSRFVCPFCGHEFGPSCGPSTLWTYVGCLTLVGSVHFVDLYRFFTLVGSVHFVDMNFIPLRGSSTVWINVKVYPYRVCPICGLIMFLTLVRSVHFVDLRKGFTLIGSVHFVDLCRIFPLWGTSSFRTSLVVKPRSVRPLTVVIKHSLV